MMDGLGAGKAVGRRMMGFAVSEVDVEIEEVEDAAERSRLISSTTIGVSSSSSPSLLKNGGARCSSHNGISELRTGEFSRGTRNN